MILPAHEEYLYSRGYNRDRIEQEDISSMSETQLEFRAYSMSGTLIGRQVVQWSPEKQDKQYLWFQEPGRGYLPLMYGAPDDYWKLHTNPAVLLWKEVVICEGIFDRIALKLMLPEYPVFARLSRGVGRQMGHFLRRYAKRVLCLFDNDGPGTEGYEKTRKMLEPEIEVIGIQYPAKDPSALWEKYGSERGRKLLIEQIEKRTL